jgi:hypothetical protein
MKIFSRPAFFSWWDVSFCGVHFAMSYFREPLEDTKVVSPTEDFLHHALLFKDMEVEIRSRTSFESWPPKKWLSVFKPEACTLYKIMESRTNMNTEETLRIRQWYTLPSDPTMERIPWEVSSGWSLHHETREIIRQGGRCCFMPGFELVSKSERPYPQMDVVQDPVQRILYRYQWLHHPQLEVSVTYRNNRGRYPVQLEVEWKRPDDLVTMDELMKLMRQKGEPICRLWNGFQKCQSIRASSLPYLHVSSVDVMMKVCTHDLSYVDGVHHPSSYLVLEDREPWLYHVKDPPQKLNDTHVCFITHGLGFGGTAWSWQDDQWVSIQYEEPPSFTSSSKPFRLPLISPSVSSRVIRTGQSQVVPYQWPHSRQLREDYEAFMKLQYPEVTTWQVVDPIHQEKRTIIVDHGSVGWLVWQGEDIQQDPPYPFWVLRYRDERGVYRVKDELQVGVSYEVCWVTCLWVLPHELASAGVSYELKSSTGERVPLMIGSAYCPLSSLSLEELHALHTFPWSGGYLYEGRLFMHILRMADRPHTVRQTKEGCRAWFRCTSPPWCFVELTWKKQKLRYLHLCVTRGGRVVYEGSVVPFYPERAPDGISSVEWKWCLLHSILYPLGDNAWDHYPLDEEWQRSFREWLDHMIRHWMNPTKTDPHAWSQQHPVGIGIWMWERLCKGSCQYEPEVGWWPLWMKDMYIQYISPYTSPVQLIKWATQVQQGPFSSLHLIQEDGHFCHMNVPESSAGDAYSLVMDVPSIAERAFYGLPSFSTFSRLANQMLFASFNAPLRARHVMGRFSKAICTWNTSCLSRSSYPSGVHKNTVRRLFYDEQYGVAEDPIRVMHMKVGFVMHSSALLDMNPIAARMAKRLHVGLEHVLTLVLEHPQDTLLQEYPTFTNGYIRPQLYVKKGDLLASYLDSKGVWHPLHAHRDGYVLDASLTFTRQGHRIVRVVLVNVRTLYDGRNKWTTMGGQKFTDMPYRPSSSVDVFPQVMKASQAPLDMMINVSAVARRGTLFADVYYGTWLHTLCDMSGLPLSLWTMILEYVTADVEIRTLIMESLLPSTSSIHSCHYEHFVHPQTGVQLEEPILVAWVPMVLLPQLAELQQKHSPLELNRSQCDPLTWQPQQAHGIRMSEMGITNLLALEPQVTKPLLKDILHRNSCVQWYCTRHQLYTPKKWCVSCRSGAGLVLNQVQPQTLLLNQYAIMKYHTQLHWIPAKPQWTLGGP